MAYNNGFPATYPQYYQPYPMVQQPVPQVQQAQTQAPRQTGFVPVQSENDARMYPVAPGNSITFIDENAPYCYVKTMGFSQLDRPRFEKYRLVKEEEPQPQEATQQAPVEYATKHDVEDIWKELKEIREKFDVKEIKEDE